MRVMDDILKHKGFKKYFANSFWLFVEKIFRMLVGLFVGVWMARYLGPRKFGLLSYVQSFVGLFSSISTLGLDKIIVRELVKDENNENLWLGTSFVLKIIGSLVLFIILAFAVHFTSNDRYTNILIFIIASSITFQSFNVIELYFQSKVLAKYIAKAKVIGLFISSVLKIMFILKKATLTSFACLILIDSILLSSLLVYYYLQTKQRIEIWEFSKQKAKKLLKASLPLLFSGIAISIFSKIDQVMLKVMLNSESVGQYAAAVKISTAAYSVPGILVVSLTPAIVHAKKVSEKLYYQRLQYLYDLMVILAVILVIPTLFLSDRIILLLYGMTYFQASSVLKIHICSAVFVFLGTANSRWFIIENYTNKIFYRTFLGAFVNVVANYFMIPVYGIQGAAIGTLFAQISSNLFYDFFDKDVYVSLRQKLRALLLISFLDWCKKLL